MALTEQPNGSTGAVETPAPARRAPRHRLVATCCVLFVGAMVGAAYAAVPLYDLFCKATGFGGTTRVAAEAPSSIHERTMEIRFDSNIAPGLAWSFQPEVRAVTVKLGETKLVYYRVTNHGPTEITAAATYNVAPGQAGSYFAKLQCFCFTDQTLQPGETREMPVAFFVDPSLADDPEAASLRTITLSYTFFPKAVPLAAGGAPAAKAPL